MRKEVTDAPRKRKLPVCGPEELCAASRRGRADCGELGGWKATVGFSYTGRRTLDCWGFSQALLWVLEWCLVWWRKIRSVGFLWFSLGCVLAIEWLSPVSKMGSGTQEEDGCKGVSGEEGKAVRVVSGAGKMAGSKCCQLEVSSWRGGGEVVV